MCHLGVRQSRDYSDAATFDIMLRRKGLNVFILNIVSQTSSCERKYRTLELAWTRQQRICILVSMTSNNYLSQLTSVLQL